MKILARAWPVVVLAVLVLNVIDGATWTLLLMAATFPVTAWCIWETRA